MLQGGREREKRTPLCPCGESIDPSGVSGCLSSGDPRARRGFHFVFLLSFGSRTARL